MDDTLLLRALLSPAGHVAWTGLTVAAIWAVPIADHRGRAIIRALGVVVAAVALHAAWDGINTVLAHRIVGGVSFIALMVVIRRHRSTPPSHQRAGQIDADPERLLRPNKDTASAGGTFLVCPGSQVGVSQAA